MLRSLAVAGGAAPDLVWRRYAELDLWPQWAPFITAVDATERELRVGLSGIVHGPLRVRAVFEVDAVDAVARTWHWSVRSGPLHLDLGHEVIARPGGGTVATLGLQGAAPVVLGYLGPAALALRQLVRPSVP